jgi:hypothetical protein
MFRECSDGPCEKCQAAIRSVTYRTDEKPRSIEIGQLWALPGGGRPMRVLGPWWRKADSYELESDCGKWGVCASTERIVAIMDFLGWAPPVCPGPVRLEPCDSDEPGCHGDDAAAVRYENVQL